MAIRSGIITSFLVFFLYISSYGQEGYHVEKDARIKKYQLPIIDYLKNENQFTSNDLSSSIEEYQGKMYVRKELEVFRDKLLLVRFGSLGDHVNVYWGVLGENEKCFFIYGNKNETVMHDFLEEYDLVTQYIVLDFIKRSLEAEAH